MMTFKERMTFLESIKVKYRRDTHPNGTYVSAIVDEATQSKLDSWVTANKIPNACDPSTYHSTVVYSRKGIPDVKNYKFDMPVKGSITEWKLFPTQKGANCLVAIIGESKLDDVHKDIRQKYGATHDYPDYHPHITVSYDFKGEIPGNIPNIPIVYDSINIEPLDTEFAPPKKSDDD